eukprot:GHVT01039840.1.p1 GENE.GHVT01039840.1~~GHVT01039840.1.p1  ORF type:complete len:347 (-),score=34.66 GHVT01039840.1:1370-2410(-)
MGRGKELQGERKQKGKIRVKTITINLFFNYLLFSFWECPPPILLTRELCHCSTSSSSSFSPCPNLVSGASSASSFPSSSFGTSSLIEGESDMAITLPDSSSPTGFVGYSLSSSPAIVIPRPASFSVNPSRAAVDRNPPPGPFPPRPFSPMNYVPICSTCGSGGLEPMCLSGPHMSTSGLQLMSLLGSLVFESVFLNAHEVVALVTSRAHPSIDLMLLMHADSPMHVRAIANRLHATAVKEIGKEHVVQAGTHEGGWIVLEILKSLSVHVFTPVTRARLNLEQLNARSPIVCLKHLKFKQLRHLPAESREFYQQEFVRKIEKCHPLPCSPSHGTEIRNRSKEPKAFR